MLLDQGAIQGALQAQAKLAANPRISHCVKPIDLLVAAVAARHVAGIRSVSAGASVWATDSREPSQTARMLLRVTFDHPSTLDPDGRVVVFDAGTRLHLALGRPKLMNEVDLILGAVAHPDHRVDDRIPGREHFYRHDLDPQRWLRVVVDFNDVPAWVVTALVQTNPPRGYKP